MSTAWQLRHDRPTSTCGSPNRSSCWTGSGSARRGPIRR
ncbi:hypothetical protein DB31_0304 [Hyalangium minutum]|uniref:Uncharacterized protein n=1 Tax=Hyalangium minutum TaxID=394096 RepID=A0A085WWI0_9BACT|nr:hypothetical protein DB31_0304 [Hyalangium minutum]